MFFTAATMFVVSEAILRFSEKYANYYESNGEDWDPGKVTNVLTLPWLWIHQPNQTMSIEKKEYRQDFYFGADGLPGDPLPLEKSKNEYRIIIVGDSFVQGFGDTEGLGVSGRLQQLLDKNTNSDKQFQVMNAGIGGSDPV